MQDVTIMPDLLTCEETYVYGDSSYVGGDKRVNAVEKISVGRKFNTK